MALERGIQQFYFAQGVDTAFDAAATPVGKLHILENGFFSTAGAIKKKDGSAPFSTTIDTTINSSTVSSLGAILKVLAFNLAKMVVSYNSGGTWYQPIISKWDAARSLWQNFDSTPNVSGSTTTPIKQGQLSPHLLCDSWTFSPGFVSKDYGALAYIDCEYYNGNVYYVTSSTGRDFTFGAYDYASKNILFTRSFATTYFAPKLRKINNKIYIFFYDGTSSIWVYEFDPATSVLSGPQLVVNNTVAALPMFDVSFDVTNNRVYLVYKLNTNAPRCVSYSTLISGTLGTALTPVNTYTGATPMGVHCAVWVVTTNLSRCFISYSNAADTAVSTEGLTLALASSFGPHTTITGKLSIKKITGGGFSATGSTLNTGVFVSYVESAGEDRVLTQVQRYSGSAAVGSVQLIYNMEVLSTCLASDPNVIAMRGTRPNQQSVYLYSGAFDATGFSCAGKLLYGRLFGRNLEHGIVVGPIYTTNITNFARVFSSDTMGFFGAPVLLSSLGNVRDATFGLISEATVVAWGGCEVKTFDYKGLFRQNTKIAGGVILNGGSPLYCDGEVISEVGHYEYPDAARCTLATAGAGNLGIGAYSYALVFEWKDGNGKVHLSSPSAPVSITTTAGNQRVTVTFRSNNIGDKPIAIRVYRTAENGSVYTFLDYMTYGSGITWTLTDNSLDSTIAANEILYTLSGELANINPGACSYVAASKDRVWGIFEGVIKYSKVIEGIEPPEFADELTIDIESSGGAPVAIAPLQDKMLFFKNSSIYFINGSGPNDTGTYGDFSKPEKITDVYGCISPMSVIAVEDYVYFQSGDGIHKIGPDLVVVPIGRDLSFYFDSAPTILTATVVPTRKHIRFSDGTRTYVWNYEVQQWAVFTVAARSSAMIDSNFYRVDGSYVLQEDRTNGDTRDNTTQPALTVGTGWLSFENIEGFSRVYSILLKFRKRGNTNILVKIMYDDVPVVVETHTITLDGTSESYIYPDSQNYQASALVSGADFANKPMVYRIKTSRQKVSSLKVIIQDEDVGSTTGTVDVVGIAVEYGFKKNVAKLWMGDGRTA